MRWRCPPRVKTCPPSPPHFHVSVTLSLSQIVSLCHKFCHKPDIPSLHDTACRLVDWFLLATMFAIVDFWGCWKSDACVTLHLQGPYLREPITPREDKTSFQQPVFWQLKWFGHKHTDKVHLARHCWCQCFVLKRQYIWSHTWPN